MKRHRYATSARRTISHVGLEAIDDATHITLTNRCASREQRVTTVSYGAEAGAKAASESVAALLGRA